MQNELVQTKGSIEMIVEHKNGTKETIIRKNTVLQKGREALASSLGRAYGGSYEFYVNEMHFGTGGVDGSNNPKYIDSTRNSLYDGSPVVFSASAVVDTVRSNEVVFTAVLPYDSPNSTFEISEMGLRMATGDLYSMATFPVISKTVDVQITFNWRISFV